MLTQIAFGNIAYLPNVDHDLDRFNYLKFQNNRGMRFQVEKQIAQEHYYYYYYFFSLLIRVERQPGLSLRLLLLILFPPWQPGSRIEATSE